MLDRIYPGILHVFHDAGILFDPCYPALALLLGSAMAAGGDWIRRGTRVLSVVAGCAGIACITIFFLVRNVPAPGDISSALGHHPSVYTLSLGHMMDLTFDSFAYLRLPLAVAAIALLGGALATFRCVDLRSFLAAALMMVLFYHAARLALVCCRSISVVAAAGRGAPQIS